MYSGTTICNPDAADMVLNMLAVRNLLKVRHDVTEWRRSALNPEGLGTP